MLEADALTHYDSRLFLAQTLAHGQNTGQISPAHLDKIHHDIASLAQKLIAIKVEDSFLALGDSRADSRSVYLDKFGVGIRLRGRTRQIGSPVEQQSAG